MRKTQEKDGGVRPSRPARVKFDEFGFDRPEETSERLLHWLDAFLSGRWRENRRFRKEGCVKKARILGIHLWECREVVFPMLEQRREGKDVSVPDWLSEKLEAYVLKKEEKFQQVRLLRLARNIDVAPALQRCPLYFDSETRTLDFVGPTNVTTTVAAACFARLLREAGGVDLHCGMSDEPPAGAILVRGDVSNRKEKKK